MAFGFSFGGSKKNESSTTSGSYDKTSTPIVPDWLQQPTQQLLQQGMNFGGYDPQSFVADPSSLQQTAASGAGNLSSRPWNYEAGLNLTRGVGEMEAPTVQSQSVLDNLGGYMSPYTNDVVNTTLADFDASAGATRAQQDLSMAREGAFGGSGAALTRSGTEGELARARASADASLRDSGFRFGAQLSEGDANRRQAAGTSNASLALQAANQRLQAGQQFGNLTSQLGADERANVATQAGVGNTLYDINQAKAQAPLSLLDWQAQLMAQLNPGLFTGQHETGTETQTSKGKSTGLTFGANLSTKG